MFRIGDFSRFSRVSVKMLRHYDKLGLLAPAWVDPDTGYRYYTADQLPRLNRIVALKDLGFRLDQIGLLLDEALSAEQIRTMLRRQQAELEQQMRRTTAQLAQIETRLAQLEQAGSMPPYEVVVRAVAPQMVAGIRQLMTVDGDDVTALFEELEQYVAQYGARAPLPPLLIYHDLEFPEQSEDIEVMVPVQTPVQMPVQKQMPEDGRITVRQLSGHDTMACLIHTGRYDGLPHAFAVLLRWLENHHYTIAGPTRELFLRFGADQEAYRLPDVYLTENAAEYVTELQIPVADKE
jgi:DNA-binding transcriptional MerR regulator